jgi:hypothetical protein
VSLTGTSPGAARRRHLLPGRDLRRFMIGVVLIALVLFGQELYGIATRNSRLPPELRGATAPRNVIVVLDFKPERFHSERVQQYGAFAGRDGALNRIRLRQVSPSRLNELADIPWIAHIEPMK